LPRIYGKEAEKACSKLVQSLVIAFVVVCVVGDASGGYAHAPIRTPARTGRGKKD
jgi:hypothetical protein